MKLSKLYPELKSMLTQDTADFDLSQLVKGFLSREDEQISPDLILTDEQVFLLKGAVKRLSTGYPLQYLLGEWEFYGIRLFVGEGVLIPRQDTETLVDIAISLAEQHGYTDIADLCSGSGCVAIAVALNVPTAKLTALEFSSEALQFLTSNIAFHSLEDRIKVLHENVLEPLNLPPQDMILCNPPYIKTADMGTLSTQVQHEPDLALDGGSDGLVFYRSLAENVISVLKPEGHLLLEIGYNQWEEVRDILERVGYSDITVHKDLAKNHRVVSAVAPKL